MATQRLNLTRDQLAQFLKNHEQIKQFERLFGVVQTLEPVSQDLSAFELNALSPRAESNNCVQIDYIDLNQNPAHSERAGRVHWDKLFRTMSVGMDYDVIQSVGFDTYALVQNSTGAMIERGSTVGFAGVGGASALGAAKYIADGSQSTLYILGVMAHDLQDSGDTGYCATWGHVGGLDTTGSGVGETWVVGDVLYCSATAAGKLTKVKPTAPNNVIPIAAVLKVDATDGEIFVRPTIEQDKFYGVFDKTNNQAPAAINTAYAIVLTNTQVSRGVSIGSPASRIVLASSGLYQFDAKIQLTSNNANAKNIWFWFRKNGVDIPNTARIITVNINGGLSPIAISAAISANANDYIEVMYASNDIGIALNTVAATAFAPESPAVIVTVTEVQQ